MATGNSSIVVFHSNMMPNLLLEFKRLKHQGGVPARFLSNDDIFISWFGQRRLKAVPTDLGVMFRREFLSRSKWLGWLSSRLPWVIQRREKIVAVTFNGFENKLEKLIQLPDGTLHQDSKGRFGYWSCKEMGPIKDRIVQAVERHSQLL